MDQVCRMFSRDHSKLFTAGKGVFGWSITEYKIENKTDEKLFYTRIGYSVHKDYEQVFDRMMMLLLNKGETNGSEKEEKETT